MTRDHHLRHADFFSPELVCGKPYGRASDAWAVGVILFNLLTLERPFQAIKMIELARLIVNSELEEAKQRALTCGHRPASALAAPRPAQPRRESANDAPARARALSSGSMLTSTQRGVESVHVSCISH